jgi:hypothetical protein
MADIASRDYPTKAPRSEVPPRSKRRIFQTTSAENKKGGVDLSAFHATQGRRIVD